MESEDSWRAASMLIQVYGVEARGQVLHRIIAMRQSGDPSGLALWRAVLAAVLDFERFDPADDRVVH